MVFELGILNYKLLLPLIDPIFSLVKKFNIYKEKPNSYLFSFFKDSISYLSAGLVYLLVLYRSGNHRKLSIPKNAEGKLTAINQVLSENQNNIKRHKIKKIISLFLLSLVNIIPTVSTIFLKLEVYDTLSKSLGILFSILYLAILSKIFLGSKIYKHQYISLLIIFFCSFLFLIYDIYLLTEKTPLKYTTFGLTLLYFTIKYLAYSLYDVLVKRHFENYSTNPYQLMFFVGFFSIIVITPLDLIAHFKDPEGEIFGIDIINQIKSLFEPSFFLKFLLDVFCDFFWLAGTVFLLYYLTPCHFIICKCISGFISRCTGWKKKPDEWYIIMVYIFLYIVIFFATLIYNEVIIVRLCSIEKNTYKYISFRQKLEFENSINDYEEDLTEQNVISDISTNDKNEKEEPKEMYNIY